MNIARFHPPGRGRSALARLVILGFGGGAAMLEAAC